MRYARQYAAALFVFLFVAIGLTMTGALVKHFFPHSKLSNLFEKLGRWLLENMRF